jgi:hypothetical protein
MNPVLRSHNIAGETGMYRFLLWRTARYVFLQLTKAIELLLTVKNVTTNFDGGMIGS